MSHSASLCDFRRDFDLPQGEAIIQGMVGQQCCPAICAPFASVNL
jgi:hypothetical protein